MNGMWGIILITEFYKIVLRLLLNNGFVVFMKSIMLILIN